MLFHVCVKFEVKVRKLKFFFKSINIIENYVNIIKVLTLKEFEIIVFEMQCY